MKVLKNLYKSRTIWLAGILSVTGPLLSALPQAKAFLGDNYGLALLVLSGLVGYLRFVTTKPLADK